MGDVLECAECGQVMAVGGACQCQVCGEWPLCDGCVGEGAHPCQVEDGPWELLSWMIKALAL